MTLGLLVKMVDDPVETQTSSSSKSSRSGTIMNVFSGEMAVVNPQRRNGRGLPCGKSHLNGRN
ncbi:MAG: hypothetical protein NZM11_03550 [Anaerolineales bacterium]|nr:hypothetical protein [Anaerolineales bacterium]